MHISDIQKLQKDLNRLGKQAVENQMKINPGKCRAIIFTKASVKERISYYFGDQLIPEAITIKYLPTTTRGELNWADHVQ